MADAHQDAAGGTKYDWFLIGAVAVFALAVIYFLAGTEGPPRPPNPQDVIDDKIAEAKVAVIERLRDPSSAIFGRVGVRIAENFRGKTVSVVCGSVNARNGFGGMTGQVPFAVEGGNVWFYNDAAATVTKYCLTK